MNDQRGCRGAQVRGGVLLTDCGDGSSGNQNATTNPLRNADIFISFFLRAPNFKTPVFQQERRVRNGSICLCEPSTCNQYSDDAACRKAAYPQLDLCCLRLALRKCGNAQLGGSIWNERDGFFRLIAADGAPRQNVGGPVFGAPLVKSARLDR